jgi:hypothetical protein
MSKHRIAVTVFCIAEGVDEVDAGHAAEYAVRQALGQGRPKPTPYALDPVVIYPGAQPLPPVEVHEVMDTGVAAGNGYLWLRPTSRGYHAPDEPREP